MTDGAKIERRKLGLNGPSVSVIGFGTWQLAGPFTVGGRASGLPVFRPGYFLELLENGLDKGINFFETSNLYGKSEELLGKLLRLRRSEMVVATKCGIDRDGRVNVLPEFVRSSVLDSLGRLGVDYIDIYQITVPSLEKYDPRSGLDVLREFQSRGIIGQVGLSLREPGDCLIVLHEKLVDTLQLTYNLFDTRQNNEVMPLAAKSGVGVIVKSPLNKGVLTGKYTSDTVFPPDDSRSTFLLPARLSGRNEWLDRFCRELHLSRNDLVKIALRFVLSNEAVGTIALGMSSKEQLLHNISIAALSPMETEKKSFIETFSRREWRLVGEGLCNDLIR